MKYYAIGVPIGALNEQTERYFYADGQLYNMNRDAYKVWRQFLYGSTRERVLQKESLMQKLGVDAVTRYISALQESEMIVNQEALWHRIPQRQGIGVGLNLKKEDCGIFLNSEIRVNYFSYLIWVYSDGKTTLSEIIQLIPPELTKAAGAQGIMDAVDELLLSGVVFFVA